jgi:thiol-disulfide isomerase/thioredoxin/Tfp pilus assembly protein PilF
MIRLASAILLAAAIASPARAAALNPGDAAPPLQVTKWVKGESIDLAAAKGSNVVVVEFWATWCPPCIVSIPHLTKLQKEFAGKGVVVVGVTKPDARNSLEGVEKFVSEKGATMDYRVAFDGDGKTYEAFMKAAGQGGIPTAFIVDKTGTVAWIGHPMRLDRPLEEVLAGTFDIEMARILGMLEKKATDLQRAKKGDDALRVMEALAALDTSGVWRTQLFMRRISAHLQAKEPEKAAAAIEKAIEGLDDPQSLRTLGTMALSQETVPGRIDLAARAARKALEKDPKNAAVRLILAKALFAGGKTDDGVAETKKVIEAARDEAGVLNDAAWSLLTEGEFPRPVLDVALAAAERCHEITKGENWMYLDTLALAKWKTGDAKKAIELERKALDLAEKAKAPERTLKEFRDRLAEFEKAVTEA